MKIGLPKDIEHRLTDLAKKTGRTKSFYAREAIIEHLGNLEDIYLSEKVAKRIRSGEERTYTLEEVEAELGLTD